MNEIKDLENVLDADLFVYLHFYPSFCYKIEKKFIGYHLLHYNKNANKLTDLGIIKHFYYDDNQNNFCFDFENTKRNVCIDFIYLEKPCFFLADSFNEEKDSDTVKLFAELGD